MYKYVAPTEKKAINLVMNAVQKLADGCETIYPAKRRYPELTRFLHANEAEFFNVDPVSTSEWVEQAIRGNMDKFNLDGGWSDVFSNESFDLRIEKYDGKKSVVVVPWDKTSGEHQMDDTWLLFKI